jgi:hypothetical protein
MDGTDTSSLGGAGGEWYQTSFKNTTNNDLKGTLTKLITLKKKAAPILNSLEDLAKIESYYKTPTIQSNCKLGVSSFNIDPYGYVRFCFNMEPIGNLKKTAPRQLFLGQNAWKSRRDVKNCAVPCHWAVF